jgi:hypothetical protein
MTDQDRKEAMERIEQHLDAVMDELKPFVTKKLLRAGPYGWTGQASWRIGDLSRYIREHLVEGKGDGA